MRLSLPSAMIAVTFIAQPAVAKVVGQMTTAEPIGEARIAQLPKAEQAAWRAYLARSQALMTADKAALAAERKGISVPGGPPSGPGGGGGMPMDRPAAWYGGPEARRVADAILSFQTPAGGWGKNQDRAGPARLRGQNYVPIEKLPAYAQEDIKSSDQIWRYVGTIDNNATISELRFLARVQSNVPGAAGASYRAALLKGLRYLLTAQFPNGGWPQVFPLQGGYHDALTYNDGALQQVAELLADAGARQGDFAVVPDDIAGQARAAVGRAISLVIRTQVVIDGKRTLWGQQHDALTLGPVGARNFEPASLASDESVDLLLFLMRQPDPSPEIVAAVDGGVAWLRGHALSDVEWTKRTAGAEGRRLVAAPGAGPLWARIYDLRTAQPIFGDRDKTIHDDVNELSVERRNGYSWFTTSPARMFAAYERWRRSLGG